MSDSFLTRDNLHLSKPILASASPSNAAIADLESVSDAKVLEFLQSRPVLKYPPRLQMRPQSFSRMGRPTPSKRSTNRPLSRRPRRTASHRNPEASAGRNPAIPRHPWITGPDQVRTGPADLLWHPSNARPTRTARGSSEHG